MPFVFTRKSPWPCKNEEWFYVTAGELINELKKYPADTPIVHEYDSSWGSLYKPQLLSKGEPAEHLGRPVLWINPDRAADEPECWRYVEVKDGH